MKMIKRLTICALFVLCSVCASAYDFSAVNKDGVTIYYNIVNSDEYEYACMVADDGSKYAEYGSLFVPSEVVNEKDGKTYTVLGVTNELLPAGDKKDDTLRAKNEEGNPNITE